MIDDALNIPDFRASENIFQLLVQVSGRSERGALPGEVIIQTQLKDNPTIQCGATHNIEKFYQDELQVRKLFNYPPYSHFLKLTFSGKSEALASQYAKHFYTLLKNQLPKDAEVFDPIPSGYPKIKDKYRFKLLIKENKVVQLSKIVYALQCSLKWPKDIRLLIDVGPLSTFS